MNITSISAFRRALLPNASQRGSLALLHHCRRLHITPHLSVVKPFLLADIGEGITECQLIQWFVQPGARVEQFDKLCEVQSDKASVEITSPFDGVIKKLHYDPDDMAITGKPLVDIDIQGEISEADEEKLGGVSDAGATQDATEDSNADDGIKAEGGNAADIDNVSTPLEQTQSQEPSSRPSRGKMSTLATPAVRHLTKEFNVELVDITGTGRDGRVLKEDVHRYVSESRTSADQAPPRTSSTSDRTVALSPVQRQMFKLMTRSLNIPHFLYSCTTDLSSLSVLRKKVNASRGDEKITHLPFIIKAVSLAFLRHPLLNTSLDTTTDPSKPSLTFRGSHDFGVAVDTPSGLLVPVLRNVQDLSVSEIAAQIRDISVRARNNKLSPQDFNGASFTVSNIGSVGGGVVSPVISEPQVAILGIGRSKVVPAFDDVGELVKKEELVMSWSADHRVVDGAECARCAERVRTLLQEPASMMLEMR